MREGANEGRDAGKGRLRRGEKRKKKKWRKIYPP